MRPILPPGMRYCTACEVPRPVSDFGKQRSNPDGLRYTCRECTNKKTREFRLANGRVGGLKPLPADNLVTNADAVRNAAERADRLASDFAALKPEDFAVGVGNDEKRDRTWTHDKRQEYSKSMGEFAEGVRSGELTGKLGDYVAGLAEQERRFSNRRLSRSVSISAAHAELARELFKQTVDKFFRDKITPTGYATKPHNTKLKRTVVLHLSDLHLGASMDSRGNPLAYREVEEARRLEYVIRQALDYKPQHREQSELLLLLNGDVIDGYLKHDERAGLPLTEQKAVFWSHLRSALGLLAQQYKRVRVVCQPGNHGRNIARHPGRATEDKWDGIEWDMYYALSQMCSGLLNVSWEIPFRAVSIVDLYGQNLLVTHGDTEPGFKDPDTGATFNANVMDRVNSTLIYGAPVAAAAIGHFHKGRDQASRFPRLLFNPALVPPNGYARAGGMIGERQGQTLWEAVEGHIVGDVRFLIVGEDQDRDERLGSLIKPFRFPV